MLYYASVLVYVCVCPCTQVWVPADGTTEGRSELNERDFDELTSIAAAAAAAEKQKEKSPVYQLPTW